MNTPIDRDAAQAIVDRLRAFAQPQRLSILSALLGGEMSVAAIYGATGIGQPALSQQLGELRRADVVVQHRASKSVVYRIVDARTEAIVRFVLLAFGSEEPLDVARAASLAFATTREQRSAAMFAVVDEGGASL